MIITEEQKREIESLIPEHGDALINYGADMYRQGIFKRAGLLAAGMVIGFVIEQSLIIYKDRKSKKNKEES